MESTFYTAKEAAAFLEVTDSEIYQMVVVKNKLRPIIFISPPPPFERQTFALCPESEEYWDPFPAEYYDGKLWDTNDYLHERVFVYVRSSSLTEINYPFCQKGDSHYATLVDETSSLLGPVIFEDQEGGQLSIEILGSKDVKRTGPTSMPFIMQTTKTAYLCLTNDWIFTHSELERVKYGKSINSEVVSITPISGQQTTQRIELIEREMSLLGIDPKAIENIPGKPGPKALIRKKLLDSYPLFFPTKSKFDDAWRYALRENIFEVK